LRAIRLPNSIPTIPHPKACDEWNPCNPTELHICVLERNLRRSVAGSLRPAARNHLQEVANLGRVSALPRRGGGCYFGTLGLFHQNGTHSVSMVASGSTRIGIPLRMGYTRLHSLHFRASSPRSTKGLRHTGQASISSRSDFIMVVDFSSTRSLLLSCLREVNR